jgi:2-amino-4-hydroxy-6-hydroxymethyldihydropteridine diphosphokinase
MREPADIYVAVGSNITPEQHVPEAVRRLREAGQSFAVSTFYRTRPLARPEQEDFRNGVVWFRARLEREVLERDLLKSIETALGRVRSADKDAARPIDLDLAVYSEAGRVSWIDPEVLTRNFIAIPLAELAPGLKLPNGMSAAENADALGRDGLIADEELTRSLKEWVSDESRTR